VTRFQRLSRVSPKRGMKVHPSSAVKRIDAAIWHPPHMKNDLRCATLAAAWSGCARNAVSERIPALRPLPVSVDEVHTSVPVRPTVPVPTDVVPPPTTTGSTDITGVTLGVAHIGTQLTTIQQQIHDLADAQLTPGVGDDTTAV
jgi:hypothetical protein